MWRAIKLTILFVLMNITAAPLTSLVLMDVRQTEWMNLLTYVWLFGAMFVWEAIIGGVVVLLVRLSK